jgi:hypothetical protein
MAKLVYVTALLFSEAERQFLGLMADTLARASGLVPLSDFLPPHRDGGELGKWPSKGGSIT